MDRSTVRDRRVKTVQLLCFFNLFGQEEGGNRNLANLLGYAVDNVACGGSVAGNSQKTKYCVACEIRTMCLEAGPTAVMLLDSCWSADQK